MYMYYGDAGEEYVLEMEDEKRKKYPPFTEMLKMAMELGIKYDPRRDIKKGDAWAHYYELKALLDEKQRKTA